MRPFNAVGKYITHTDLYLLLISLLCSGYGLVLIYSATRSFETNRNMYVQGAAILLGILAFVITSLFDFEALTPIWPWLLGFNVVFQLLLIPLGTAAGGNQSWIVLGPISLQPAEIGKLLFIFTLASHLSLVRDRINHWTTLLLLTLHLFLLMGVIMVSSSDLGMALTYFAIFVVMLFAAGLSLQWFVAGGVLSVASVPLLWQVLQPYQKNRILVLLEPAIDSDLAYQTTQSKIAIGAGQMYGTGFLQGNQIQFGKVPAKQTDFIFSVAGEELGFIGCIIILMLLSLLILRLFYVSYKADSMFSSMAVIGIAGMFLFQTFENIMMCLGLFPVMGLTLPFFSYGGTSVVTMFIAVGIAAGVRMREKPNWLQR